MEKWNVLLNGKNSEKTVERLKIGLSIQSSVNKSLSLQDSIKHLKITPISNAYVWNSACKSIVNHIWKENYQS